MLFTKCRGWLVTFKMLLLGTACLLASCSKAPPKSPASSTEKASAATPVRGGEVRKRAQAGVGKRGQKLMERNGILSAPAKQIFATEQKLMFMKADQALKAFEVMNDRYPRSTKEYMDGVIKANYLTLPELPAGDRYEFDTKTHTLMVVQGQAVEGDKSK